MSEHNGEMIAASVALKQQNPELKILVAIGGWSFGVEKFTAVSKDLDTMKVRRVPIVPRVYHVYSVIISTALVFD